MTLLRQWLTFILKTEILDGNYDFHSFLLLFIKLCKLSAVFKFLDIRLDSVFYKMIVCVNYINVHMDDNLRDKS